MTLSWVWFTLGVLTVVVLYQQFRIYRIHQVSKGREELFQIVTENAADMIALVDVKGHRLYNSPAYKRILGYSSAELGGTSSFEQIHPDDRFKVLEAAREARATGVGRKLEYRVRHKDGTWRVLESLASTIRDQKGNVSKMVIVNRDVTERKRAEEQLEHNSFHDELTGLPNRRLFLDRLQNLFARTQRSPERQYAVLFVDLDNFKAINDRMSPAVGDQVIVEIGQRLATCLRHEDTVSRPQDRLPLKNAVLSRMGGDEFTILLEGVGDPSDAMRAGQRILSAVAEPLVVSGGEVRATASIGIALGTTAYSRADELLQDADVAMSRAQAMGGNRCELFDEAMHTRAVNRLKLESELREAMEKRQFRVYYQPIVLLKTRQIVGFEALMRWQHPSQGLISPVRFIQAAEDSGLMFATGQWLIAEACKQLRSWKSEIPSPEEYRLSVNVSARQLADPGFVGNLETIIRQSGIEPSQLHVELTEDVAAANPTLTFDVLSSLKQLRIGVILDDFGSGHSSLSLLRQLSMEAVKIDRSLVNAMLLDRAATDTVELIFLLAQKLKLKVIAEGIESAKQLERLLGLGCEFGQGFFLSQPVEARAAGLLLQAGFLPQAKVAGAQ